MTIKAITGEKGLYTNDAGSLPEEPLSSEGSPESPEVDMNIKYIQDHINKKVIEQLLSFNQHDPEAFGEMTWQTLVDKNGIARFSMKPQIRAILSTGQRSKGLVTIRRFFDKELKEWIYKTERTTEEGKTVITQSRLVWDDEKQHNKFKRFNREHEKVIEQLLSQSPHDPEAFDEMTWETEMLDTKGLVNFSKLVGEQMRKIELATGKEEKGPVTIRRFFDKELKEWIYKTERTTEEGKTVITQSRLVWDDEKQHNKFKRFNRGHEKVIEQLLSQFPHDPEAFNEMTWETETLKNGIVVFVKTADGSKKSITLSTGSKEKGPVTIRRFFDKELKEWMYKTERNVKEEKITRLNRLVKKGEHFIFRQLKIEAYPSTKDVEKALENRQKRGKENSPDALLWGKYPNKSLLNAARCFGIKLPEITILDQEFNREAQVTSLKTANEKGNSWTNKGVEKTLEELNLLLEGMNKEESNGNEVQRGIIKSLIRNLERIAKDGICPLLEYMLIKKPLPITPEEIEAFPIAFVDEEMLEDSFQSRAAKMALHPKVKVALIQGGPGSGKSRVLAEVVGQLCNKGEKVLVVSRTNTAVDNLLLRLDRQGIPIIRACSRNNIGRVDPRLKKYQGFSYNSEHASSTEEWEKRRKEVRGHVVGVTTGSMDLLPISQGIGNFDTVIIDEAATLNEVETILAAAKAKKKIILAGDHKQLEPFCDHDSIRKTSPEYQEIIKKSGMEQRWLKGLNQIFLARNYRCHPILAVLIGRIVYDRLVTPKTWQFMEEDTLRVINVPSKKENMGNERKGSSKTIISHEDGREEINCSYENEAEANVAIEEFERAIKSGYRKDEVSIIAGYRAQVNLIREKLKGYLTNSGYSENEAERLAEKQVDTVDKFQGDENSVIIFSFVRSNLGKNDNNNKNGKIGHMGNLNRLNVAFSRAKDRLVIIGDEKTLRNVAGKPNFSELYEELDNARKDFNYLWVDQQRKGMFTIREAIQSMNGVLQRELKNKMQLNSEVIKKLEEYFSKALSDYELAEERDEEYRILGFLHEHALRNKGKIELQESQYEEYYNNIWGLANDLPEFIDFDENEGVVTLKWLKENDKHVKIPITVEKVDED